MSSTISSCFLIRVLVLFVDYFPLSPSSGFLSNLTTSQALLPFYCSHSEKSIQTMSSHPSSHSSPISLLSQVQPSQITSTPKCTDGLNLQNLHMHNTPEILARTFRREVNFLQIRNRSQFDNTLSPL